MTLPYLAKKRLCEHAVEFGGVEGSSVFARSFERMGRWVEVAGKALDAAARGLERFRITGKRLNFLQDS